MSVILCFDSVEDAALAEEDVNMLKPSWVVSNSSHADFSALKDSSGLGTGSPQRFDGQVNFQATFEGKLEGDIKTAEIESHVRQLAGDFGKVLNFARGIAIGPEVKFLFRVEYYCISDAKEALRALSTNDPHYWQVCFNGIEICVRAMLTKIRTGSWSPSRLTRRLTARLLRAMARYLHSST